MHVPTTTTKRIGRTLSHASLRRRSGQKGVWILTIKGDRGDIALNLTDEEAAEIVRPELLAEPDTITLNLKLEAGTLAEMRASVEKETGA